MTTSMKAVTVAVIPGSSSRVFRVAGIRVNGQLDMARSTRAPGSGRSRVELEQQRSGGDPRVVTEQEATGCRDRCPEHDMAADDS